MADKTLVSQYDGTHVKVGDRIRRFDKGAVIPAEADADHVQVLLDRGMVAEGKVVAGAVAVDPDAPPPFPLPEEPEHESRSTRRQGTAKEGA